MKYQDHYESEFYPTPSFYDSSKPYQEWLYSKAKSHYKRDKKRSKGEFRFTHKDYRLAINKAFLKSKGLDFYTNEKLDWSLVGTYDNRKSQKGRRNYKSKFALLPTIDHTYEENEPIDIVICGWRTNDAKNDLKIDEFVNLCELVIKNYRNK
ncbi:hypothetical protein [Lewinella sp. IMCC34183]|uniref:hypothetical protein n=1 Tax=Lewinella sp. IMCC34183 TaxID=2248762 RepID=UPI0013004F82|nr:hypothetical protein [Lewinella sp. IMCC34183]